MIRDQSSSERKSCSDLTRSDSSSSCQGIINGIYNRSSLHSCRSHGSGGDQSLSSYTSNLLADASSANTDCICNISLNGCVSDTRSGLSIGAELLSDITTNTGSNTL